MTLSSDAVETFCAKVPHQLVEQAVIAAVLLMFRNSAMVIDLRNEVAAS